MKKLTVLTAGFIGYVLGSRAGRERYEQIKKVATRVKDDPRVQERATQAADLAKEKAPVVKDKVVTAAGTAADKVSTSSSTGTSTSAGTSSSTDRAELEEQLNPDSVALQDDPYPQGDLP